MAKTKNVFQAEIQQLLNLMIHSLYSHREIFLRELLSNGSDAIDKLRYLSLTDEALKNESKDYFLRLEPNKEQHTLKIVDNGIGMTREEAEKFLGTIANSGTKAFLQNAAELKDKPELIGQFGVGFYSAFMVADRVVVHTQKAGSTEGILWESSGDGSYTVDEVPRAEGRGTTITLFLKPADEKDENAQDFTDEWTLKSLVKKYSDFVAYPIKMNMTKTRPAPGEDKSKTETYTEDETLNSQKALWLKSPSEIKKEEYDEFYKHISHDWADPALHIHYRAEGTMEFSSILYVPAQRPWNYFYRDSEFGLNLYVKRVFIKHDTKDLLPTYLRFVKGMVDSSDLSLNVSREILQQNRQVTAIRKSLTTKILNSLKDWQQKDRTAYENFWNNFGATLKEGVAIDGANKEKIAELGLFHSTQSDKMTTLDEYIARMPEAQKAIYFLAGENLGQLNNSPYLEQLKVKGYEVLLLTDTVDEWFTDGLKEYKNKQLQSIVREDLDLDSEEEKKAKASEQESLKSELSPLISTMQTALAEDVREIKLSERLTSSPAVLVSGAYDPSANMQRILSQMQNEGMPPKAKRILEINPKHAVIRKMKTMDAAAQSRYAEILYAQALLNEGSTLPDPAKFAAQISELMVNPIQ